MFWIGLYLPVVLVPLFLMLMPPVPSGRSFWLERELPREDFPHQYFVCGPPPMMDAGPPAGLADCSDATFRSRQLRRRGIRARHYDVLLQVFESVDAEAAVRGVVAKIEHHYGVAVVGEDHLHRLLTP